MDTPHNFTVNEKTPTGFKHQTVFGGRVPVGECFCPFDFLTLWATCSRYPIMALNLADLRDCIHYYQGGSPSFFHYSVCVHSPSRTSNFSSQGKKKKRSRRRSSVVALNQAQGGEAAIPLPVQSTETDRRPFFYHNGMREEDIVEPTMDLVAKYTGTSSRDRAIRSLSIANSFEKKPWLTQVRIALALTSSTVKRDVGHLKTSQRKNVLT